MQSVFEIGAFIKQRAISSRNPPIQKDMGIYEAVMGHQLDTYAQGDALYFVTSAITCSQSH